MQTNLLPEDLKEPIREFIEQYCEERARESLPYSPSHPGTEAYFTPDKSQEDEYIEGHALPVPPAELWAGYGQDAHTYLDSGKLHVTNMINTLESSDFFVDKAKRIMEFGCSAGRMIRHLPELAPKAELWGVDISAQHIRWCIDHLTPTIHFATSTMHPHLPFEDRYFDLVFCGSVFTHIEDTAETWMLELGRILRPGGRIYITLHDEHTVKLLDTELRDHYLAQSLLANSVYRENRGKFHMIVVGRRENSQVFYHSDYFRSILPPCFRVVSYTREAYGYQSAAILEKVGA
ncbi:methyltransferase domain-containing protein [bacterium]|nr:methyltransferase domain-containing protein [bacterium]